MPVKKGQWMGGIRTIEDVKLRCWINDETDCWHWRGCKTGGKYPKVSMRINGEDRSRTGVKAVMAVLGKTVEKGQTVYHYKCNAIDCLNPNHLKIGTFKEKWEHIKAEGYLRGLPHRKVANKQVAMRRCKVAEHLDLILNSDLSSVELAEQIGVAPGTIRAARRRAVGTPQVANSSVFNWRPAA